MKEKIFDWNDEKNKILIRDRKISFEEVIHYIENEKILSNIDHPNQEKYPGQKIFIIEINEYVYLVPYVIESQNKYFLKTVIPSRKAKKEFLGGKQ